MDINVDINQIYLSAIHPLLLVICFPRLLANYLFHNLLSSLTLS